MDATAVLLEKLRPEDLAVQNETLSTHARDAARGLYAIASSRLLRDTPKPTGDLAAMLPELYVENFDPEQIWMQIETQTEPLLKAAKKLLKKAGEDFALVSGAASESEEEELPSDSDFDQDDEEDALALDQDDSMEDDEDQLASDDEDELKNAMDSDDDEGAMSEDEELEDEEEEEEAPAPAKKKKLVPKSIRQLESDGFFSMDDMEKFLQDAEEAVMRDPEDLNAAAGDEDEDGDDDASPGASDEEDEGEEEQEFGLGGLAGQADESDMDSDEEALERLLSEQGAGKGPKSGAKKAAAKIPRADSLFYKDFFGAPPRSAGRRRGRAAEGRRGRAGEDEEDEDEDGWAAMRDGDRKKKRGQEKEADDEEGYEEEDMPEDADEDDAPPPSKKAKFAFEEEDLEDEDDEDEGEGANKLSTHEKRLLRLRRSIARLEERAIGDRPWELMGEAKARDRPMNSALEIDLDFDLAVRPAPKPTEETTKSLEDLIKKRIAEQKFDDPIRFVAPPPQKKRPELELNDEKSKKGLADIYEDEFLGLAAQAAKKETGAAAAGVAADDKEEPLRREARGIFRELCGRLDALCHFHFAPKPYVEDLEVTRPNLPAIAMEEVLPVAGSNAESMKAPEEIFKPAAKKGDLKAETELSREERRRRRADKKRASKADKSRKEEAKKARAVAQGGEAPILGRKSAEAQLAAQKGKKGKKAAAIVPSHKSDFSKSGSAFQKIQEAQDQAKAGIKPGQRLKDVEQEKRKATNFKL